MIHRFFVPPSWISPSIVNLRDQTAHQIRVVLRMQPDDSIIVLDDSGIEWHVNLTKIDKDSVQGKIIAQRPAQGEPALHLTLYQGTLKAQKFEWVLQKGTELGVSCFVPTICQRSIVRRHHTPANKNTRWQHIIREAAEQSGRGKLPRLEQAMSLPDALTHAQSATLVIMPWPEATEASFKEILGKTKVERVALFIGPEGGFTADEIALGQQFGAMLVRLGPRILRAETAGLAACAAIFYELDEWN
jgi:16S rRNA (uracil1498-N3)-methyltransferase